MKQFIGAQDYNKLSMLEKSWLVVEVKKIGKKVTFAKGLDNVAIIPKLSIGDLLAILERNNFFDVESISVPHISLTPEGWYLQSGLGEDYYYKDIELITVLWEAVMDICGKTE